ncbi:MAG: hypothetical protein ACE5GN_02845, partial [Waddliaceae bacterium]
MVLLEGIVMDHPISPISSSAEAPLQTDPCDLISSEAAPPVSTDSLQMLNEIETISFKIFSWLSAHSQQDKKVTVRARSHSTPPPFVIFSGAGTQFGSKQKSTESVRSKKTTHLRSSSLDTSSLVLCQRLFSESAHVTAASLQRLRKKGFLGLAKKLEKEKGYPRDDILKFDNPMLIEQLLDLYEMLALKGDLIEKPGPDNVFKFALHLAKDESLNNSQVLGELICLLNTRSEEIFSSIEPENLQKSVDWIHQNFAHQLEGINSRLLDLKALHSRTGIQNENIAVKNRLPIEIAQILISGTGRVNVGIIDNLLEVFLTNSDQPINYEINLAYALRLLQVSPKLREKLSRISKPSSPKAPANVVIRTSLELPYDTSITNVDAIKTALAAILSHLRQGSDGSCFVTPLAIELLSSHLDRCVDDYATLLQSSKLTRMVNKNTTDFPFLLRMGNKNLDQSITLTREGRIVQKENSKGLLREAPGIIAACQAIHIEAPSSGIAEVIRRLFKETKSDQETLQTTICSILKELIKYARQANPSKNEGIAALFMKACFAFEAQENNPLLQVWENAIAGMAEAEESSMVRSAIICSVMDTLKGKIKEILPSQPLQRKKLSRTLQSELISTIHLQYDPIVPNGEVAKDQRSTEGAFVLYDKTDDPPLSNWFRVDNPKAFQEFVSRIIERAKKELKKEREALTKKERKALHQAIQHLSKYVKTTDFIATCLSQYYHENTGIRDPIANFANIQYAPWITKSGNNFSKVIQVYLEDIWKGKRDHFFPLHPTELLIKIIEMGKQFSVDEKKAYESNPYRLIPIRIPGVHAFSLMLGHPTLSQAWGKSDNTEAWILEHVVAPGKEVAGRTIEQRTRDELIQLTCQELVGPEKVNSFLERTRSIPNNIPIKEFRTQLLEALLHIGSPAGISPSQLPFQLDTYLYQCLPKREKIRLESSAVHFADTNWSDGIYDIHFCFTINPGNGKL